MGNPLPTPDQRGLIARLDPMGRYPILVQPDGSSLWETDAIICHLSASVGSDLWRQGKDQPEMIRWLS